MALIRAGFLIVAWSLCCSCSKDDPLDTRFAEPRPAQRPLPQSLEATFDITPKSRLEFSAPARDGDPSGYFSRLRGEIWLDLFDLEEARGKLEIDLGSVHVTGSDDPAENAARSREAKRWLDVRGGQPTWATFVLESVDAPDVSAAHEGRKLPADETPGAAGEAAMDRESREVRLTARGPLTLNSVRIQYLAPLSVTFHYPAPAISGALPDRLELSSRSPVRVRLEAHDIEPRNAAGVVVAEDLVKLGKEVGREARITASIEARRRDR